MTLFLTDADVVRSFTWTTAVDALRAAYGTDVGPQRFPARTMARGRGTWLRTLAGVAEDTGLMGAKLIAASPRNGVVSYLVPLFDEETAELVALLDGHSITGFRTAATTALAADLLAPPGPVSLAVIGSGFEARNHLRALAAVREVTGVRVFSPNPDSRARFAADLAGTAGTIEPAGSAAEAVAGSSVVLCAARSRDESPTLTAEWLAPGATVLSIGSTLPEQREVDTSVLAAADLVVADMVEEVLHDTGDLLAATGAGVDVSGRTVALADVVSDRVPGRTDPGQTVVYKSVGAAVQDIAVAATCVRNARELGLGTPLPATVTPIRK
ncbi:ornithine cyclodeaminase family protein [Blastococcus sp. SYSU D00820]